MKQDLLKLISQKDQIQKQLASLTDQIALIQQTKDFNNNLVDAQGFPRQDLDFGQLMDYKNLKRRKAQLNNDHSKLMKDIQGKMFQFHKEVRSTQQTVQYQQKQPDFSKIKPKVQTKTELTKPEVKIKEPSKIDYLTPFARITSVQSGSPAQTCGLVAGDLLSSFSEVNIYTPDNIKQIPHYVQQGRAVDIAVLRPLGQNKQSEGKGPVFTLKDQQRYQKIEVKITPQKWQGRGLIGCKIDPI